MVENRSHFLDDKDYNTWMMLSQIYKLVHQARSQELSKYDITPEQAGILFCIKAADTFGYDRTLKYISKCTLLKPHSISEIVSRMENKNLVKKEKGPRNVLSVNITNSGEHAYKLSIEREPIHNVFSCLSKEERIQLDEILKKLLKVAIQETTKPFGPPSIIDVFNNI